MRRFPFLQVDAFADRPLHGNPCAVLLDADSLTEAEMQAIARETNQAETAFVLYSDTCDFKVRYFTPAEEIPLAGHPTLATTCALIDTSRFKLSDDMTTLTLELKVGPIRVEVYSENGQLVRIVMNQPAPKFLATYNPADVMPVFGLDIEDLLPGYPIQTVSTGTPQLMIPLQNLEALRRAQLDIPAYNALRAKSDFFSPHLFCLSGITPVGTTFARQFGTPPDLPEDPFTGSATGGMAAYLWHYGLLETPNFIAEQGHWMQRPGQGWVEVIGPRDNIQGIRVGGMAIVILRGELTL
ncbi:MAG: PhzF family phenazine biosynthesis protein [Chloroflexi bacterium]|nr:PhzF family phenazine biosynthesis protein [Chloroflexota bacterium]